MGRRKQEAQKNFVAKVALDNRSTLLLLADPGSQGKQRNLSVVVTTIQQSHPSLLNSVKLGIFPILGISKGSLGQNFDPLGIPKTHNSLGILIYATKVGILGVKQGQKGKNAVSRSF